MARRKLTIEERRAKQRAAADRRVAKAKARAPIYAERVRKRLIREEKKRLAQLQRELRARIPGHGRKWHSKPSWIPRQQRFPDEDIPPDDLARFLAGDPRLANFEGYW